MARWKPEPEPESDDKEEKPPAEPSGFDLTDKRKRQAHSREWARKTYDEIGKSLHEQQKNQKYVNEPRRRRNAAGD
jgi:hypothetical protein